MATKIAISDELSSLFEDDQYMGAPRPLPHVQLLNDKSDFGLFVKMSTIDRINWIGPKPDETHPNYHNHIFSSGDSEEGLLFKAVTLKVLSMSDRFIEERGSKTVLGNFETDAGKRLYEERSDLQLRRLFLVYLCDGTGKRLHASPVTLSVMGVASARLGQAYEAFCQELDAAYAAAAGKELVAARSKRVYALASFNVQFGMELYGPEKGQKSPICVVADFVHPTPSNLNQLFASGEERNFLWSALDTFEGTFAERFLRSCEEALGFKVAAGVFGPADPETGEITLEGAVPGAVPALPF